MAKLSKSALKMIVKECLIEILQEGLMTDELMTESHSKRPRKNRAASPEATTRRIGLDKIKFDKQVPNKDFEKNVRLTAQSMTDDPVLSSILADTAMTTLQEQIGAESRGSAVAGSDRAAVAASRSNPEDLFGESASKWAELAFAGTANKTLEQE
jgi:hypothetical protein